MHFSSWGGGRRGANQTSFQPKLVSSLERGGGYRSSPPPQTSNLGKWQPRGSETTVLTCPGSAPRKRARHGQTPVRWAAAHPGQDRRLPSVVTHSRLQRATSVHNQRWGSSSKTAPGSLSTGSPAGRTPPHGNGSLYSKANVRVGKCAA